MRVVNIYHTGCLLAHFGLTKTVFESLPLFLLVGYARSRDMHVMHMYVVSIMHVVHRMHVVCSMHVVCICEALII